MNIEPVKDGDAGGLVIMDDGGNLGVTVADGKVVELVALEKRVAMLEARVAALEGHAHDTERMRGSRN